jgi:uncharacterized protein (DUF488 family)
MRTIYSIGHTQKSLEQFIGFLRSADVDAVIDIRLRNTSQLAGFAKRDDLAFLLGTAFGITYEHHLGLAPTPEILDAYKVSRDWAAYERAFRQLMADRKVQVLGLEILSRHARPCLLCSEPKAERCHRRLVAEWWSDHLPDLTVIHL